MRTPLYAEHEALGARLVAFGGWDMPVAYRGILDEHQHTRRICSVFDICHMGKFEFRGPAAAADLDRLLTPAVAALAEGRGAYGYLLDETGGVLDDVIVFRRGPDRFWLVVNAGTKPADAAWIRPRLSSGTVFEDLDERLGKLDIQGPRARACVEKALGARLPDLRYFHMTDVSLLGAPCAISRTGYTGEFGYELYPPLGAVARFWKALLAPGDIRPAGLGARDTLRLEMGYPLYGHELSRDRTPAAATGSRFLALDTPFIGREAVVRDLEQGPVQRLVGLRFEGRMAARAGDEVIQNGRAVGRITSGLFSPSLQIAIALAYVEPGCARPGAALQARVHGKILNALVVPTPFYPNGTCRLPAGAS
jgi:aminomethyltransferase